MKKLLMVFTTVLILSSCSFERVSVLYLFPEEPAKAENVVLGVPDLFWYRGEDIPIEYTYRGKTTNLHVTVGDGEGSALAYLSVDSQEASRIVGVRCLSILQIGSVFEATTSCRRNTGVERVHVLRVEYPPGSDLGSENFNFVLREGGSFVWVDGV